MAEESEYAALFNNLKPRRRRSYQSRSHNSSTETVCYRGKRSIKVKTKRALESVHHQVIRIFERYSTLLHINKRRFHHRKILRAGKERRKLEEDDGCIDVLETELNAHMDLEEELAGYDADVSSSDTMDEGVELEDGINSAAELNGHTLPIEPIVAYPGPDSLRDVDPRGPYRHSQVFTAKGEMGVSNAVLRRRKKETGSGMPRSFERPENRIFPIMEEVV